MLHSAHLLPPKAMLARTRLLLPNHPHRRQAVGGNRPCVMARVQPPLSSAVVAMDEAVPVEVSCVRGMELEGRRECSSVHDSSIAW